MDVAFILRRLFQSAITILGAVTVVFLILRLTPGDPTSIILGDYATPELVARVNAQYGLDKSIPEQYFVFMKNSFTGDFGNSLFLKSDVLMLVRSALPHTVLLAVAALLVTALVGIPLGIISALKRNTVTDYIAMVTAMVWVATPSFWLALLVIYVLSYRLGWFPIQGIGEGGIGDRLHHLILPAVVLGIRSAALVARTTRSAILEVMNEEHVRTARAKGLSNYNVFKGHVWRNALIPIVTILGLDFGQLLGGSTIIEIVFGRPGIGKLLVEAILTRDYPLSQALIVTFLLAVTFVNLLTDIAYGFVDPRLRTD